MSAGPQRTKSGQVKIEPDCPKCNGTGETDDGLCESCAATGKVTLARHHELVGLKPKLETPIPPTDPDPEAHKEPTS